MIGMWTHPLWRAEVVSDGIKLTLPDRFQTFFFNMFNRLIPQGDRDNQTVTFHLKSDILDSLEAPRRIYSLSSSTPALAIVLYRDVHGRGLFGVTTLNVLNSHRLMELHMMGAEFEARRLPA